MTEDLNQRIRAARVLAAESAVMEDLAAMGLGPVAEPPPPSYDGGKPIRPDLAIGAITVAMKTTTDGEVGPWLQTALDFLTGQYEPLDDGALNFTARLSDRGEGLGGLKSQPCADESPPVLKHAPSDLRPEVLAFAHLMEDALRANDHKPGWKDDHPLDLMTRMRQEAGELGVEVVAGSRTSLEAWRARVGSEAADVANFAMMVADVCGALNFTARLSDAKEDNRASRSQPVSGAVGQDSDTGKVSG